MSTCMARWSQTASQALVIDHSPAYLHQQKDCSYLALAPPLDRAKQRSSLGALLRCHMLWLWF